MELELNGETYIVRDSEKGYEVIFPDGGYNVLVPYLDDMQETAFRFIDDDLPQVARELGELIIRETM